MPPASDVRLWAFGNSTITSYNGTHGTVLGPRASARIFSTTDGSASGTVVLSAGYPWHGGDNFGIWLHGARLSHPAG